MKKIFALIVVVMLIFSGCTMNDMNKLPEGDFISSSYSPEEKYRIDSFLCSGNATTDFAVRCEVVDMNSGDKHNIYWEYHQETVDIEWIDETTVVINDKELNILTDVYDWRNE